MTVRRAVAVVGFAAVLAVGLGASAGCARLRLPSSATPIPPAASRESTATTATSLGAVEIRDYKGKRLDAVASEPDNSIKGPQHVDTSKYRLRIGGLVGKPISLSYNQVTDMPAYKKVTTLNCVEGWSVTYLWQGVRINDLIARAGGAEPGATVVIFRCYDGYTTSLPLAYIRDRNILLAYRMNDVTMPPERGFPFQVVAEDQLGYKWAKWVTDIELSSDTTFRGFWEQRGYENTAPVPGTTP
jgi:DMSO/TMAO reductase YedYZ molybdopterin-dependent catalytic subunit